MTRLGDARSSLRHSRSRLKLSWERVRTNWKDSRGREFETLHQVPLERATLGFEKELDNLDREVAKVLERLPDR